MNCLEDEYRRVLMFYIVSIVKVTCSFRPFSSFIHVMLTNLLLLQVKRKQICDSASTKDPDSVSSSARDTSGQCF